MPDFTSDSYTGEAFEASVRQVAGHIYADSHSTGSIILDGRERDEIIDTGTELVIIEATKKRTLEKIKYDMKKSAELVKKLKKDSRYGEYNFRIILVTRDEPTADQNSHVSSFKAHCPKEIISFTTLFSRLFDSRHYIRVRGDHFFGSIRNPANDQDLNVPESDYIPTALSQEGTADSHKASDLATMATDGGQFVIFGDYGSGKSMTLRDIYLRLKSSFVTGETNSCPIYLNLREHIAQTRPDEALYRHADVIGFPDPQRLISAWRAGYVNLILDGFDELTPPQFAVSIDNLRQARRFAVELVKRFLVETPNHAAVYLAGRESYFDDRSEAKTALGYRKNAKVFDLAGFTDADIKKYLDKKGENIPLWLPTRPLLLGYIANSEMLDDVGLTSMNPAAGWDTILARVCEREVEQIWGVGFEPSALRLFIEGLATRVRHSGARKSLRQSDLRDVFQSVFTKDADEPAELLTSRLPGLGSMPGKSGSKEFIDDAFLEAAASGDLSRYIDHPFEKRSPLRNVEIPAGELCRELACWRLGDKVVKLPIALNKAAENSETAITAADVFSIMNDISVSYTGDETVIRDAYFDQLEIGSEYGFSAVKFEGCIFSNLELERSNHKTELRNFPRFHDCAIDKVVGVVSESDIPHGIFTGSTSVEEYVEFSSTNEGVLRSNLSSPVKVLITVLRKLFLQRGSGRRMNALRRGLPQAALQYVDPIVDLVRSHDFAHVITLDRRDILMPNRSKSAEAFEMVNGPNASNSPLIEEARLIG